MRWHADPEILQRYQAQLVAPAVTASIETHLMACAACRAKLASLADADRLERNWDAISARVDRPALSFIERALARIGVAEHRSRLVMSTPALRLPWLIAMCAVLATVALLHEAGGDSPGTFFAFLVLAPVLPLAGVEAAFNGRGDPVRELISATPLSTLELVFVRTVAVVGVTSLVTAVATIPFALEWTAAVWLLPALGMSAATLALATWMPASWAAAGLGTAWVAGAATTWRIHRVDPEVVDRFFAFRPSGQLLFAVVLLAGAAVVVLRREALEMRRVYA